LGRLCFLYRFTYCLVYYVWFVVIRSITITIYHYRYYHQLLLLLLLLQRSLPCK